MADSPLPRYRMYKDNKDEWRWTYLAKNGIKIAVSSESYKNKADRRHSIDLLKASADDPVYEVNA